MVNDNQEKFLVILLLLYVMPLIIYFNAVEPIIGIYGSFIILYWFVIIASFFIVMKISIILGFKHIKRLIKKSNHNQ